MSAQFFLRWPCMVRAGRVWCALGRVWCALAVVWCALAACVSAPLLVRAGRAARPHALPQHAVLPREPVHEREVCQLVFLREAVIDDIA